MESNDSSSIMKQLSEVSSMDELPLLTLLEVPYHLLSEEQKKEFTAALRSARVNTHVLVTKIEREVKPKEPKAAKAAPKLDISDLL